MRSSRKASDTGVALDGLALRSPAGWAADSRSHVTSPSWHSRSSIARPVALDPPGQDVGLPGGDRRLVALQLLDDGPHAVVTPDLRARGDVLPAQQEAHEVLRGDGLDRLAPALARVRVHAGQQPAGAPFDLAARWRGAGASAAPAPSSPMSAPSAPSVTVKRPWRANPSFSSTASPTVTVASSSPDRAASAGTVTGPDRSRWPRSTAAATSSRGWAASGAPPATTAAWAAFSVAHQSSAAPPVVDAPLCTRPRVARRSYSGRQGSCAGVTTNPSSRSCSSSGDRGSGATSSRTRAMASGSSRPMLSRSTGRPRRRGTALVRRSCSSASSRKAYGLAVRISWLNADASVVSRKWTCTWPVSMPSSSSVSPSMSRPSVMVSCIVWRTIGWSGISIGPATFSWQAAACGNSAAIMSSDSMRWIGGGLRRPALEAQHDQRPVEVPPPAALEHRRRRRQHRLLEHPAHGVGVQEPGHVGQREAVVRPERQHDRVVVGRRLQLEVERHAEPLAQRQAERPVDPTAVGRVHDQVHALGVVEEPLEHEVGVGGDDTEHGAAGGHVVDDLVDRGVVERGGRRQPAPGRRRCRRRRGSRRAWPAARRSRATARPCAPGPRRSRTGWWGACRRRRPPARHRRPPGGSATSGCRAGRCRRASTRPPSLR